MSNAIENNLGTWSAHVQNEGKTPQIIVNGRFPTNGHKPGYHLVKNDPQGINPEELLLTLMFGNLVDPKGDVYFTARYSEVITTSEQYKTVLVMDPDGRSLAQMKVEQEMSVGR
ncbi:hypothetical protein [Flavobacterium sp.]|uniref:hypothetical protein n=1 Tax=Flavobacterium sp. TaxID=239 RepID=UPI002B4AE8F7|nr:hypothetical protein [Flavobacterium sp.]HLF53268.1 hypothetical protein [Flavobacterium sp.]